MEQEINKLIEFHKKEKNVLSGAIIGSYAKGQYVEGESDIDLLFIVSKEFDDKMIEKLSNLFTIKEYYDVYAIETNKGIINISYYMMDEFKNLFYKIIECRDIFSINKPWAVGGVCDDVLMEDIQKAIIYFDKVNILTEVKCKVNNCDLDMWHKEMEKKLKKDIAEKKNTILKFYCKKQYMLAYVGLMELGQLEHRLLYAERREFYPGFKHISRVNNGNLFIFKYLDEEKCSETVDKYLRGRQ